MSISSSWENALRNFLTSIPKNKKGWVEQVCKELMKNKPNEETLYWLILKAPDKFKERAYKRLTGRRLDLVNKKRWFGAVVMCGPEPYRTMSWKKFLALKPSNDEIRRVASSTRSREIRVEGWKKIFAQKPSTHDLRFPEGTIVYVPEELRDQVEGLYWKAYKREQNAKMERILKSA